MNKKIYEISFVLSGRLIEAELSALIEKIKKIFEEMGAKIIKDAEFIKIHLSYAIKKEEEAFFGYFWFELEPTKLSELKRSFTFEKNILRYLVVTPPPKYKSKITKPRFQSQIYEKIESQPILTETPSSSSSEANLEKLDEKLEEIQKLA